MMPWLLVGQIGRRVASPNVSIVTAWDPAYKSANLTLSNSNKTVNKAVGGGSWAAVRANAAKTSGYFEVQYLTTGTDSAMIGLCSSSMRTSEYPGGGTDANGVGYYWFNGRKYNQGTSQVYAATYGNGDIIGVLLNGGSATFYKNGVSLGVAFGGLAGSLYPAVAMYDTGTATLIGRFKAADQTYPGTGGVPAWE